MSRKVKLVYKETVYFVPIKTTDEMSALQDETRGSFLTSVFQFHEYCDVYLILWGGSFNDTSVSEWITRISALNGTLLIVQIILLARDSNAGQ
jgi:hypothetical protein